MESLSPDASARDLDVPALVSAVSSLNLGVRLRAIHNLSFQSPSVFLPVLLPLCNPDNPCQTSGSLVLSVLCDACSRSLSILPEVLPSILSMATVSYTRCIRMARIPLNRLISACAEDPSAQESLTALATSLNIEYVATRKRPLAPSSVARSISARNADEDRLVHERLDILPPLTQIELIMRCVRLNLPDIVPLKFSETHESFRNVLMLLIEQATVIRDPRLRDPRLRSAAISDNASQLELDFKHAASVLDAPEVKVEDALSMKSQIEKKQVPEVPVPQLTDETRSDLINGAFDRIFSSCTRSSVTEAIVSQLIAQFDTDRVSAFLEKFKKSPAQWCSAALQMGYALVARGHISLYTSSLITIIDALWSAPAGTLSNFLCCCALLAPEALDVVDKVMESILLSQLDNSIAFFFEGCSSDNELRRTTALFALRNVILKRPANRETVLNRILKYTTSANTSLRKPAVALISQQIFPLGDPVQMPIINFAAELFSTMSEPFENDIEASYLASLSKSSDHEDVSEEIAVGSSEEMATDLSEEMSSERSEEISATDEAMQIDSQGDLESNVAEERSSESHEKVEEGQMQEHEYKWFKNFSVFFLTSVRSKVIEDSLEADKSSPVDGLIEAEAGRRLELYFALCSKRHDLFAGILSQFSLVSSRGSRVRASIHKNVLRLVKTIGATSPALIDALKQSPSGSEPLVLHVLHILTDGVEDRVSPAIVEIGQICYSKSRDARFLIPVMSGMSRGDVLESLPNLVSLPKVHVEQALKVLLSSRSPVSPSEVLVRLHLVAPTPDHPLLRKVMDATQLCIFNRDAYTDKVLAVVLQQVVERNPIPVLFMRTLIQVLAAHPLLTEFAMSILSKLVNKRIWDMPNLELWHGFIVCCRRTIPQSYPIMLQLPSSKLAHIIDTSKEPPQLRHELARFVQNSRLEVRRSILSVLGLARRPR